MSRVSRPKFLVPALVAIVLTGLAAPAKAIQQACWGCYAVTIPDPTGGSGHYSNVCLYDGGHATGCIEYGNGGCVEWWPGQCI